ncbi:hypothetical protein EDF38_0238 [Frigoribacterium sp. PhB160]|uniref:hypothetical protein n=1 Tax=Frigoribacterium sp. PhB160 TaxID=2485192 RepID=UPI000F470E30|nr:hypothetical protein [Frigoribacterium sp. PhB160]ROS61154.1 hypothetical protein EDF38_0238 [Frigoribacterium sp. PhB160]
MTASEQRPHGTHLPERFEMPENHLDVVVSPGSIDTSRRASLKTTLIAVVSMPLFFLLAFTICYVSASHAPVPHDLALTIGGPASITDPVAEMIDDEAPAAFDVTQTISADDAREAVATREAVGAVVVDGSDVTTVIASGGGALATQVVQTAGQEIADELGGVNTVEDASPLPADDPGGSVLFFLLVACTVGPFLSITAISQVLRTARTRTYVATAAGAAVLVPVIAFSMISLFVDYGVTFGTVAAVLGVAMIYAFTVGLLATFFTKVAGQGGVLLVILFLVALNFPSAGGTAPESMLPPFWQVLHQGWLGAGAFEQMRNILFFAGDGSHRWLMQLLIWTATAAALVGLVTARDRRRSAAGDVGHDADGNSPSVGAAVVG